MVLKPLFNIETNMVLLPLYYGVETTQILYYHHSNFNFSNYGTMTTQIWCYYHSNLTSPRIEEEYIFKTIFIIPEKGTMILKYYLF